ncbi:MAG: hypothetical protein ACREQ4_00370 [Candidatus Binataceae bacterium]
MALVLSVIPGAGQLYKRHPWRALAWFFGVVISYNITPPFGLIIHLICAGNAALSGAIREEAFSRSGARANHLGAGAGQRS